ncbi:DNA ligase [endosymbiont of Euscepes postfasciatus]|uniref:NAD-dependent DNA ligase LigA n=1 Tax=endosymbiont of Euscepes postfasciatus TaxID=650377 RepID=UPI000DC6D236|nr:NAD-dependent DNA ligase LigA [endosymbiont of Euscepes postfasciatus]BBA84625.1 DNA ligase [endosymbiont of Euscepes postfasciatus]
MNKIKLKIISLIKKINYFNYNYNILNKSIISDNEYDFLYNKLEILSKKYPNLIKNYYINNINNNLHLTSNSHKHILKMISIKSTYSIKKIYKFEENIIKKNNIKIKEYCCELKLDGIAINIIYKNNNLYKILTRGNGEYGEDITKNKFFIKNIPDKIVFLNYKSPSLVEIRGELCISNYNFDFINKIIKEKYNKIFVNKRHAVSGIIRNKIKNKIYYKLLNFIAHGIGYCFFLNKSLNKFKKHNNLLNYINKLGFETVERKICKTIKESIKYINFIEDNYKFNKYKYLIDGVILKINSIKLQNILGNSSKYPNWSIAYKFNSTYKETILTDVTFNITKNGNFIPIGKIKSINISGINIKKIFLHNIKKIKSLDLMIGDYILIYLSGNLIPTIKNVIKDKRNNEIKNIFYPKNCLSCNYKLSLYKDILKCNNFFCKSKIKYKISHFFSKKCIYIKYLNKKNICELIDDNFVKNIIDIFKLDLNILNKYIKNNKKVNSIYKTINGKVNINIKNFLYALNIENIGEKTLSIICNNIKKYEELFTLNNIYIKDLNKNQLKNINIFFSKIKNINFIKEITQKYINIIF